MKAKPRTSAAGSRRHTMAILRSRSPVEWLKSIRRIKSRLCRTKAACIVWWDFFAERTGEDRWEHLDKYLRSWNVRQKVTPAQLEAALLSIGYHADDAKKRSTPPKPNNMKGTTHATQPTP